MPKTALILGASGRFGRTATAALTAAGWHTRPFARGGDDLMIAAQGADVIVNGWNPPYDKWAKDVPGLTVQVIKAAQATGARVVLPGNVYVYGPEASDVFSPTTPHRATNPLGKIRIEMEAAYREAGVKTLILRAGDFLDTEASGNWFDMVMAKRVDRGIFEYPGNPDLPHAWAFLPDMTRAMAMMLAQEDRLPRFLEVGFEGYTLTGRELAHGCSRIVGRPVRLSKTQWWPIRLASPFWKLGRHLLEMRYLWNKAHRIDGEALASYLPEFRATPLDQALAQALEFKIHPDKPVPTGAAAILT